MMCRLTETDARAWRSAVQVASDSGEDQLRFLNVDAVVGALDQKELGVGDFGHDCL